MPLWDEMTPTEFAKFKKFVESWGGEVTVLTEREDGTVLVSGVWCARDKKKGEYVMTIMPPGGKVVMPNPFYEKSFYKPHKIMWTTGVGFFLKWASGGATYGEVGRTLMDVEVASRFLTAAKKAGYAAEERGV